MEVTTFKNESIRLKQILEEMVS